MPEKCELAKKCPIVKYFSEQNWNTLLTRYCYGHFTRCSRYQLRQSSQGGSEDRMPWDGIIELHAELTAPDDAV